MNQPTHIPEAVISGRRSSHKVHEESHLDEVYTFTFDSQSDGIKEEKEGRSSGVQEKKGEQKRVYGLRNRTRGVTYHESD